MKYKPGQILTYKNPDPRCTIPFSNDPCGYCWSYARHVDKGIPEQCGCATRGCEFWEEEKKDETKEN